jgi:integrase
MVKRARGGCSGLTNPNSIGKLRAALRHYPGELQVRTTLLLCAYLLPCNTELLGMRWREIDQGGTLWSVPGPRMKMKLPQVASPLPWQALASLRDLPPWTRQRAPVVPSPRDQSGMVCKNTFDKALRSPGFDSATHVHHGLRIAASTTLNELGLNRDWIERQLARTEGNRVRKAYTQAEHLEGRTKMMQPYADWLDEQEKQFGREDKG